MTAENTPSRSFHPEEDPPRLARLLREATGVDVPEEVVRRGMSLPGHDPTLDRWVAEDETAPDRLVAHALIWKAPAGDDADIDLIVHPARRREGLGTYLFGLLRSRAVQLGARSLRVYVDQGDATGNEFARRRGLEAVAAYTEMRAPLVDSMAGLKAFPGFTFRSYDEVASVSVLLEAMNRSYEGLWGHHPLSKEDLAAFLPELLPDGIFIAFDAQGEVAGTTRVEVADGEIVIDSPGIVPAHRENDDLRIGLLLRAMAWARSRGYGTVGLQSWGDDERTLALYRSNGFEPVRRSISYRLDIVGF